MVVRFCYDTFQRRRSLGWCYGFLLLCLLATPCLQAQVDSVLLNLPEVLELALGRSIELKRARSEAYEQELGFARARMAFVPQLFANATLPSINRAIEVRPLPDGRDEFVNRSTMYNDVGLSLEYQMERTGGRLMLQSNLERLDIFKTSLFDYRRTYFISPLQASYSQPVFAFNELKWQKERLSLLYLQFKENYARIRENILMEAIESFGSCFLAQNRVVLAKMRLAETDSVLVIKRKLFDLGRVSRSELVRLELTQNNNDADLRAKSVAWQHEQIKLADKLGLAREILIVLAEPDHPIDVEIDVLMAMDMAISNAFIRYRQQQRLREAEADQLRASRNRDIAIDLDLTLGVNSTAERLGNLFSPLLDRQIFRATFRAPLTGYERYRLGDRIAAERYEQEVLSQELERLELSREAFVKVTRLEMLRETLTAKQQAQQTAAEILQLVTSQFLSGEVSYADLTVALQERQQALLDYYDHLIDIIRQYYDIRRLCMYDFEKRVPLRSDLD